jgi:hypothetical protein
VFHQADIDAVFVDFDGRRYEIRQVKAVSKSPWILQVWPSCIKVKR